MSQPRKDTRIATYTVRERQYEIHRFKEEDTDRPVFVVVDIDTGLVLTTPHFFTEPDVAQVEQLIVELGRDVDTGLIDWRFEGKHERLSQAVGRSVVIGGRILTVRPSQRGSWRVGGWDLVEDGTVLNTADPFGSPPTRTQIERFVAPERQHLDQLMGTFRIVAGPDYQYEDVYRVLHGTGPVPRYVAITHDETYALFHLAPTLKAALDVLAARIGDETGGTIYGIWDLHADVLLPVQHRTSVWVVPDPAPPQEDEQQPGTHRVGVRLAWQERLDYDQVIDIDVPNGYTGHLKDLIDVDDHPATEADGVEGVPAGFVTNWLNRAHFAAPRSVGHRVITTFYGAVAPLRRLDNETTG
jgi:hypothetical protein